MFIIAILQRVVFALLRIYELLFIVRAIMSWFPMAQGSFTYFLHTATEPVLAPIRAILQKIPGVAGLPIDLSVLVAFILIDVLRTLIIQIL